MNKNVLCETHTPIMHTRVQAGINGLPVEPKGLKTT